MGAFADMEKANKSHTIHVGKGKMRNKHYVSHNVPLIVYANEETKLVKAFRNILGV